MNFDPDAILIEHLLGDDAVTDLTTRVFTETPDTLAQPWARVTLLDDPSVDGAEIDHLIAAWFQIDCFAGDDGGQEDASDLSKAIRQSIRALPDNEDLDVVVTASERLSRRYAPDSTFKPAMPRYILTATVYMHP